MDSMINIPERLEELLKNSEFIGPVNTFVSIVTKILDDNKLPFFPDYTDHGRQHVENVLKTEVELIPDIVWEKKILVMGQNMTDFLSENLLDGITTVWPMR